jgi:hypothetical protein
LKEVDATAAANSGAVQIPSPLLSTSSFNTDAQKLVERFYYHRCQQVLLKSGCNTCRNWWSCSITIAFNKFFQYS